MYVESERLLGVVKKEKEPVNGFSALIVEWNIAKDGGLINRMESLQSVAF